MKSSDLRQFRQLLTDVMSLYGKNVSKFVLTLYWEAFQNVEFERIQQAFNKHCLDPEAGRFEPKPADIVRILHGTVKDRSAIAWGKVFDAMSRVGMYQDVAFDDPIIHATVEDIGGWVSMCKVPTKDISYLQHRFCNSYKAYSSRGIGSFDYPRVLIGDRSPDSLFLQWGMKPPKPMLIGDAQLAISVYQNGNAVSGGNKAITSFKTMEKLISNLPVNAIDTVLLVGE